ncbi:MAG: hypothetical protein WAW41_16695 [Methylobacter sp.]
MTIGKVKLRDIVPIVGDGAIANPDFGDGRFIPVLIVDCCNHSALLDLILIHSETPPGDVVAKWGRRRFEKKHIYLTLDFKRPVETSASFCFNVAKQSILVDWIRNARGVYLQPTESGSKVSEGINSPKISVEIPSSATLPDWEEIYRDSLIKRYVKSGFSKTQAKEAAIQHLARSRELWTKRNLIAR